MAQIPLERTTMRTPSGTKKIGSHPLKTGQAMPGRMTKDGLKKRGQRVLAPSTILMMISSVEICRVPCGHPCPKRCRGLKGWALWRLGGQTPAPDLRRCRCLARAPQQARPKSSLHIRMDASPVPGRIPAAPAVVPMILDGITVTPFQDLPAIVVIR